MCDNALLITTNLTTYKLLKIKSIQESVTVNLLFLLFLDH